MRDIEQIRKEGFHVRAENGAEITDFRTFIVTIHAPDDSAYEQYDYDVRFTLTEQFPFRSPSVGFIQRIYHPNVDEMSGSICLDSLNKAWSPAFSLLNIIQTQLPFLLQYPNPSDPFNREAAAHLESNPADFKSTVAEHCKKYAKKRV